MHMDPRFRVAICGGGISGLCLAVTLSKFEDVDVRVYEASQQFKEIGAGVMIWSRTWSILSELGLEEDFARIATWTPSEGSTVVSAPDGSPGVGFDFRRSDKTEPGVRFKLLSVPHGCIRFHRSDFLDVFVKHLPEGVACFGKRVKSYGLDDSAEISIWFTDNTQETCDVLIGCDGIKSVIRKELFKKLAQRGVDGAVLLHEPKFSGTVAYRGLILSREVPPNADGSIHNVLQRPMMYCGKSKHIVCYTIAEGSVVNIVAFDNDKAHGIQPPEGAWVIECTTQEILECYAGFEEEALEILRLIQKPTKWWLHEIGPSQVYASDKVALVGDSIHAMLPHQGAGAGQAIEDAYVLGCILGHPMTNKADLGAALKVYQDVRAPMANYVLKASRENGTMYEFDWPGLDDDNVRLSEAIEAQFKWIWATHPRDVVDRALSFLYGSRI